MYTSSNRPSGRRLGTLAFLLLALAMLWPAIASAQTSTYCAAPLTATVSWGGSANIDVSNCDGPFDGGMSGPIEPFAQHGTVTLGPASGGTQFVAVLHNLISGCILLIQREEKSMRRELRICGEHLIKSEAGGGVLCYLNQHLTLAGDIGSCTKKSNVHGHK